MKNWYLIIFCLATSGVSFAQLSKDAIRSDFVLYQRRQAFDKNMREKTINAAFTQPLTSESEDGYREACWTISQFLFRSVIIEKGFRRLFSKYNTLDISTQRALLEAVYATYPTEFKPAVKKLVQAETASKLFAMQVLYLYRADKSAANIAAIKKLVKLKSRSLTDTVLVNELDKYLQSYQGLVKRPTPDITSLFQHQKTTAQKIIYSFQRWNRDYPGLAIIQNADGSFAKDSAGKLLVFEQLARSGSNLPYFITNGNTPQGIFSIQGIAISRNNIIGPTPNIQMVMPFETDSVFWHTPYDSTKDALTNYLELLPKNWRAYLPVAESFYAGKIGRSEIIAHGTTIDPAYFKDKPYYPISPTQGCLCAKETWNVFTGGLLQSDQFNLVNTFLSTPGDTGYLIVINIDDKQKRVERSEIENWVDTFSRTRKAE
jgi:hypothetical protein